MEVSRESIDKASGPSATYRLLIIFVILLFAFEGNSMPRDESISFERRPNISRNQGAQAPLRHALITRPVPKALMVAQARPAAPWFPKTNVSAAAGPISVVNMASSTNPLPKLGT